MPRPQFTLRALMMAMLVVAAFFGGVAFERERKRREELIAKMLESEAWSESIELMVSHLRQFPDAARVRLRLAQVLVQNERRPAQALRVLA